MDHGFIPSPTPGNHVVCVHTVHTVGPIGRNVTQQFPQLTDCQLVQILMPPIREKIINVYCIKGDKPLNAQYILSNLKPIVECSKSIFCEVRARHGYCSCECLGAIQRTQMAAGKTCDVVYRALMVCFTFADLQIQLDMICARRSSESPPHSSSTANPGRETSEVKSHEDKIRELIEQLKNVERMCTNLKREIENLTEN
jgi:hypothetical protein